nr:transketolase C-terminal domain-containing protein [Cohnella algarum]
MVQVAEEAAELLKREGIQARVVNARFVKPLTRRCCSPWPRKTSRCSCSKRIGARGLAAPFSSFTHWRASSTSRWACSAFPTVSSSTRRSRNSGPKSG